MKIRALMLLLPLELAACAHNATTPSSGADAPAARADKTVLTAHRWTLESATDAEGKRIDALFPGPKNTLTLSFEGDNAGVSGGCNQMGGGYTLDAQSQLAIGDMRSTMKACEPALMQADQAIRTLLAKPQQARVDESTPPRLRLVSGSGETSSWVGQATAEARYGGPGETMFLEVAPKRVACNHPMIPNHQCLQVREIRYSAEGLKQSPPGEWQPLYDGIEGFEFREGVRHVLRLKKFKRAAPPADASSIVYVFDMAVETEQVPADAK
jgi:heat shock protein HslJ